MAESDPTWLGLDVGGANLKAALAGGPALSMPFELWKRPEGLGPALAGLVAALPRFDRIALTMTAELCDCYATKAEGVQAVLDAILYASKGRPVSVWCIDGRFHGVESVRDQPRLAAASNWLALAVRAARLIPLGPGLLIDIGSTTADLIPLSDGKVAARGRTDTERLQTGELVYAGVRRTPIAALANALPYRSVETGLSSELFATTLDVYLTLGRIPPDPADRSTADGRPSTPEAARDRLARMIGADREDFSEEDARSFADVGPRGPPLPTRPRRAPCLRGDRRPARLGDRGGSGGIPGAGTRREGDGARRSGREPDRVLGAARLVGCLRPRFGRTRPRPGVFPLVNAPPLLIKVGGSLLDWPAFPASLRAYLTGRPDRRPLLIVGGGGAADLVRESGSDSRLGGGAGASARAPRARLHGPGARELDG